MGRLLAACVDNILKGAHPGAPPVRRPTHHELTINPETARSLGIAIPSSLRERAERIIHYDASCCRASVFRRRRCVPRPVRGSECNEIKPKANNMSNPDTDKVFSGSISRLYETYLVPLIFEPYAADLANRIASRTPSGVLEIAAGTGVVTRALASALPEHVAIVATDLNQAMLDQASVVGTRRPVEWRQADAMRLPFADETFDAVVCQFGVMFFPDKSEAFSEARRVLRPGGVFIFNVWDHIKDNEFADTVTSALEPLFPEDPPRFLARTPHGYHDRAVIERDLASGGFTKSPQIATVSARSRAASSRVPAIAYCQGTPLRNEIEARDASRLGEATDAATDAIAGRFGRGAVDGKIQAHVVTIGN